MIARVIARANTNRRAAALVMAVLLIAAVNLAVMSSVAGSGDDARVAALRSDTARAFFAAESGAALVVGEYSAGRSVPTGATSLGDGASVTISVSGTVAPFDAVVIGTAGSATRRLELRVE